MAIGVNDISDRLSSFGYTAINNDITYAIPFLIEKVTYKISNMINKSVIDSSLEPMMIDMICGEFLESKKATGQLTTSQLEGIVKKIQDGDTTVEYSSVADASNIFDKFISKLTNGDIESIVRFRGLVW